MRTATIDLVLEFRTRLIADVVTGKFDVRTVAADLPEVTDLQLDEPAGVEDIDEVIGDAQDEEVAA